MDGERLPPLTSSPGPKYSRDLSSCVPEDFTLGDRCGKRGVRFISADERKQKQRVSSFPRWVAQRGGRERCRHASSPWTCRHLGLTPLAVLVLSAVTDTITKSNWGRKSFQFSVTAYQRREPGEGPKAAALEECCSQPLSPRLALSAFLRHSGPQAPVTDSTSGGGGLHPSTSITHQENAPQTCLQAVWGNGCIFSIKHPLPGGNFSLCQADRKLARTPHLGQLSGIISFLE